MRAMTDERWPYRGSHEEGIQGRWIMKFKIEIELGNDAMKTPVDVSDSLKQVASDLIREWGLSLFFNKKEKALSAKHPIFDQNGNRVGYWRVG
jgi:hypothetical protein